MSVSADDPRFAILSLSELLAYPGSHVSGCRLYERKATIKNVFDLIKKIKHIFE